MNRGVALAGVIVSFVLVGIAAVILMKTWGGHYRATASIDRAVHSNQVALEVVATILRKDFVSVSQLCKDHGGFNTPLTNNCLNNGVLQALSAQTVPSAGNPLLDVRLAKDGSPSASGEACIGLNRCDTRSGGMMLELHLGVYEAVVLSKKESYKQKTMMVRRSKW